MLYRVGLALLLAALLAPATWAQEALRRFNIPAQALDAALFNYSQQSGLQVVFPSQLAAGKHSSPLQGEHPREAALEILLRGTGLAFRYSDPQTLVLYRPEPVAQAASAAPNSHSASSTSCPPTASPSSPTPPMTSSTWA